VTKKRVQELEWELKLAKLSAQSLKTATSSATEIGFRVMSGEYELIKAGASAPPPEPELPEDVEGIVSAVLAAGEERRRLLELLRSALVGGEREVALGLARELCNLQEAPRETVH